MEQPCWIAGLGLSRFLWLSDQNFVIRGIQAPNFSVKCNRWTCVYVCGPFLKHFFLKNCLSVQISSAVCFLLSPGASLISGATLKVDAGQSLYHSMWDIPGIHMLLLHLQFSQWNLHLINFVPALLCVFVSRPQRMARTSRGREPGRSEGHAQIREQTLTSITS